MNITTLGIDIAKNVFQLHGVDKDGKTVLTKTLSRAKLLEFVTNLNLCLIALLLKQLARSDLPDLSSHFNSDGFRHTQRCHFIKNNTSNSSFNFLRSKFATVKLVTNYNFIAKHSGLG